MSWRRGKGRPRTTMTWHPLQHEKLFFNPSFVPSLPMKENRSSLTRDSCKVTIRQSSFSDSYRRVRVDVCTPYCPYFEYCGGAEILGNAKSYQRRHKATCFLLFLFYFILYFFYNNPDSLNLTVHQRKTEPTFLHRISPSWGKFGIRRMGAWLVPLRQQCSFCTSI